MNLVVPILLAASIVAAGASVAAGLGRSADVVSGLRRPLDVVSGFSRTVVQKAPSSKTHTRQLFVNVVQPNGDAVLDLGPSDFEVTEGGVEREIVRASLARNPMRIALIVDTSDGAAKALTDVRTALVSFLDALPPEHEVMLVSTGRQTRVRVQPTADRRKVREVAAGLFSDGGATVLSDTLLEMDERFFRKAEDRWPVFVILTGDGAESSATANEKKLDDWIVALPARGISAHAIVIKYRGGGQPEIIASHVVQAAGGRYDFINTSNSVPEKMTALAKAIGEDARKMATKYQIDFLTDAKGNPPVDAGVARHGVIVQVSYRRF
jgi:Mg-chelatase subunit ChlD